MYPSINKDLRKIIEENGEENIPENLRKILEETKRMRKIVDQMREINQWKVVL